MRTGSCRGILVPRIKMDSMKTGYIDPERAVLYQLCEEKNVGITVMKGFFGGHLFDEKEKML